MASNTTEGRRQPSNDDGLNVSKGDSKLSRRPLIPDNLEDELEMVEHFVEEFRRRYGGSLKLAFQKDTLENILYNANDCPVREVSCRKLLAIYLHHDSNDTFCSEVLSSDRVVAYVNANFVVWGWDFTSSKLKHRATKLISRYVSWTLACKLLHLSDDRLPLLMLITRATYGLEVLSYIHGTSNVNDVMNCFMIAKKVFDDNLTIKLQKKEEQECKNNVSWSIPWTPAMDTTLKVSPEEERRLMLQKKLKKKKDIAIKEKLVQAVSIGDVNTILAIRDQGEDLTVLVKTSHQETTTWCMLTQAASNGHSNLLVPLLGAGLSVEGQGSTNWTPLMVAARHGHHNMVVELLSHGANPLARDQEGATAIYHATFCGHLACVGALIPATPTTITDKARRTPIHAASLRGHLSIIKLLQNSGWKLNAVDKYGNTALHLSTWFGSLEVVKYLVDSKLNPYKKNESKLTPLDFAVREGHHHIERWLMKVRGDRTIDLCHTQLLIRSYQEAGEEIFTKLKDCLSIRDVEGLANLPFTSDPHLMYENGMTILHLAVSESYNSPTCTAKLLDGIVHPHVVNFDGLTPLDLARQLYERYRLEIHNEIIEILEKHQCPKVDGSPEELYEKLLMVISESDNVKEVSRLLCAGAPMELVGYFPSSALQLAITNDRSRIFNLLLASGASLTPCTEGFNLMQQAWYSANTTPRLLCAIIKAFSMQLKRERDRLPRHTKGLREDLAKLIASVDGDAPWEACWQNGSTKTEKTDKRTMTKLTSFMVVAVHANCPLVAGFLQWAGAGTFLNVPRKTTPLHAALEEGHLTLMETMIQNLGGSLYIPDAQNRLPKDMRNMTPALLMKLEKQMYEREVRHLEALKEHKKDESEKEMVQAILTLQEVLFDKYMSNSTDTTCSAVEVLKYDDQEASAYSLLVASRSGLQQLLYLMLNVARIPADLVVDVTSGTTALHEAAAHGKTACVALLLSILKNAASVNEHNVAEAQMFASPNNSKSQRLNRFSPLQPDKYGQTALHLAAMFGHKHTLEFLTENVKEDPLCRAGTTAQEIHQNFASYLRRYTRYNDNKRQEITPLDHQHADSLLNTLLCSVDLNKLPQDAKRANVDFNMHEAEQVKKAVMRAVGIILSRVVAINDIYKGRLELVGSARDGSKLFAPDEFDINIVIPSADRVSVSVQQETDDSVRYQGHALKITVETDNPHLQGNHLMGDLFGIVKEVLTDSILDDKRLSVVPPSLTRTQVGLALALAWQGIEYPLLLVGVDLVPVLEVPWHEIIIKPDVLTPPDTFAMHISNTADGSWRCSFALLEAEVLRQLSPEERRIQLSCKMLLYFLKAERWMPREIKSFCTWWTGRSFNVPLPTGFCLKSSFFKLLVHRRITGTQWFEEDTIWWMAFVFRNMCLLADKAENLSPRKVFAYFGGDCEGPKVGHGAPIITQHLTKKELRRGFTVSYLMKYLKCQMTNLWKFLKS